MERDNARPGNEPSVVYFDEDGDTRLLLSWRQHEYTYVVSSKAMSMVCRAWKSMLSPESGFREAALVGSDRGIPLPDDDRDALEILLNIAHMHFDRVPQALQFRVLLRVAKLTEKYGATKIVRPWIKGWLQAVDHLKHMPGFEEWLFLAYAFGETDTFDEISSRLVQEIHIGTNGHCVTPEGNVLDPLSDNALFPPGIIESILQARLNQLDRMLTQCYEPVDKYIEISTSKFLPFRCRHARNAGPKIAEECDTLNFGALVLALSKIGLGPQQKEATDITGSIETVETKLRSVRLPTLGPTNQWDGVFNDESWGRALDHESCTAAPCLQEAADLLAIAPLPGLASHYRHMEQKRNELLGVRPNAQSGNGEPSGQPQQKRRRLGP